MIQQCHFSFLRKEKSHVDSLDCGISRSGTNSVNSFIIPVPVEIIILKK
jgi:hypothetical protein